MLAKRWLVCGLVMALFGEVAADERAPSTLRMRPRAWHTRVFRPLRLAQPTEPTPPAEGTPAEGTPADGAPAVAPEPTSEPPPNVAKTPDLSDEELAKMSE